MLTAVSTAHKIPFYGIRSWKDENRFLHNGDLYLCFGSSIGPLDGSISGQTVLKFPPTNFHHFEEIDQSLRSHARGKTIFFIYREKLGARASKCSVETESISSVQEGFADGEIVTGVGRVARARERGRHRLSKGLKSRPL